jgi:hypothetical protein
VNLSVKNKGFKYGFCESFSVNYFIFDCSDCSHYEYHVFFLDRTGRLQSLFVFYDIASYTATDIITLGSAPPGVTSGGNTPYLGSYITGTLIGASTTSYNNTTTSSIAQIILPNTGLYIIFAYHLIDPNSSVITYMQMNLSTVYSTYAPNIYDVILASPYLTTFTPITFSCVYSNTAASTLYLNGTITFTGNSPRFGVNTRLTAVRIG